MTLDKQTREAISAAVRRATTEAQEVYSEEWLTGEQLCQRFGFFTKEWLKRYGTVLPRECVHVTDANGIQHRTCWCYPAKKIQRMIHDGELRNLRQSQQRTRPA